VWKELRQSEERLTFERKMKSVLAVTREFFVFAGYKKRLELDMLQGEDSQNFLGQIFRNFGP